MLAKKFFSLFNKLILACAIFCLVEHIQAQHFLAKDFAYQNDFGKININKIFQDRMGIIWLGTSEGLVRFDGNTFRSLALSDSTEDIPVTAIYQDPEDQIWVGYNNGQVAIINYSRELQLAELPGELPGRSINGIFVDPAGGVWLATSGEGIYYYHGDHTQHINIQLGLNDDYIYDIEVDKLGRIWAGTDRGISICYKEKDDIKIKNISSTEGLKDNIVKSIITDLDGNLIIGLYENGFCKYDIDDDKLINDINPSWENGIINDIAMVGKDILWLATERNGLFSYNITDHSVKKVTYSDQASQNKIVALFRDSEGSIWLCDNKANLKIIDPRFIFHSKFLDNQGIKTFDIDSNGFIWYIDKNGINNYNTHTGVNNFVYKTNNRLPDYQSIISSYVDDFGCFWIGTYESGVYRYDPESRSIINLNEADGLVNNNVLSINGRNKEIWFATLGGVSKCLLSNPDKNSGLTFQFENFNQEDGLGTNYIYHVYIDASGKAWFATHGKGITVYDKGMIRNFGENDEISSNVIYSITEDYAGDIWFSTANGQLYEYIDDQFIDRTPNLGVDHKPISGIISDNKGNLIIGFLDGIGLLDKELNFFNFSTKLGPYSVTGDINVHRAEGNGNVWILAENGIINYSQHNIDYQKLPVTHIESVEVYFDDIIMSENNQFAYNENHISFLCHSTWYQDIEDLSFEYMLSGYDLNWQHSKDQLFTYPKLPSGNYKFLVKTSLVSNNLESNVAEFSFTIETPIWNRWWFYLSGAVLVALILYSYIKVREERLKQEERLQKEIIEFQFETLKSQVNPHFLFNSFNTLIAVIEDNPKQAVDYVSKLSDFFRNVINYRNTQVILLEEELNLIQDYYFLQQKRYGNNFSLSINIKDENKQRYIPPMTLQLLTENALKHNVVSRKKPISIEIYDENESLLVKNNLNVKIMESDSTGMGLENIKNRYLLLSDKQIEIYVTEEHFIVKIPLLIKVK